MPNQQPDLVTEARELLAKATPQWEQSQLAPAYVISLADGHEVVMSFGEYEKNGVLETEFKNAVNNMALTIRAPELIRQLADEVERLRRRVKQMAQDARDDAQASANEARWQERQGEDYGSY